MKKIMCCILISLISFGLHAQKSEDVVYLSNGRIIRGTIIEERENGDLRLLSTDRTIVDITASSIVKRSHETYEIASKTMAPVKRTDIDVPYGYIVGWNMATYVPDGISPTARNGAHIGVFVERIINAHFSVIPEIQFTLKGGKYTYKDAQYDVVDPDLTNPEYEGEGYAEETISLFDVHRNDLLGYLHVPVILTGKVQLPAGYLFAGAGPYVSYGVFSTTFDLKQNQYNHRETPPFYYNVYHNYDVGYALRIGYQSKGSLFFQAGYEESILDIRPNTTLVQGETDFAIRNRVVSFSIGRRFK